MHYCLPRPVPVSLLRALVISKADYCSSVLAGSPAVLLNCLQSVLNAAARLVFSARKFDHIPHFCELHWLQVPERIKFQLCVLAHRCLHDMAPCYLAETIHPVSSCASRRHLRSADTSELIVPSTRHSRRSATVRFRWRQQEPGTPYTAIRPRCSFTSRPPP